MENLTFRKLAPEDLLDVYSLWKEAGLPYRPGGRDGLGVLTKELRDTRNFLMGAYHGEALVGVALASDEGRKGWINRLAVRPSYQRKGVAKALVTICEKVFHERGLGIYGVLVEEGNQASMDLFLRMGYEPRPDIHYLRKVTKENW